MSRKPAKTLALFAELGKLGQGNHFAAGLMLALTKMAVSSKIRRFILSGSTNCRKIEVSLISKQHSGRIPAGP